MNSLVTIKETIKALIDTLHFSCVIPAIFFVVINFKLVLPHFFTQIDWSFNSNETLSFATALSLSISYFLFSSNYGLTRILEGYPWENSSLGILMKKRHESIRGKLFENNKEDIIDTFYPGMNRVLPTKFGNVIAASEFYSFKRYKIDSIILWPRILPILIKEKFNEFISQKKTSLDLFMNLFYITILLVFEFMAVYIYIQSYNYAAYTFILGISLSIIFYNAAIMSAIGWGLAIRVTFDMYKEDLKSRFNLKPVNNFKEETEQWENLCKFINNNTNCENLFNYSTKPEKDEPN